MHLLTQVPLRAVTLSALLIIPTLNPSQVQAASSDECGIWLCLPTGFGAGCSGAKSAFKKRIKRFKPPLPDFASCLVKSSSPSSQDDFTSKDGFAAYIPPKKICTKHDRNSTQERAPCIEWRIEPERFIKDQRCRKNKDGRYISPANCTGTYRYAEVYRNGSLIGQTHYY